MRKRCYPRLIPGAQEYAPTAPRKRSAKAFVTQTVIPREKPARRRPHSLSSEANGKWRSSDKHDTRKEPRPRVQLRKGAWAPQVACKASCGGTEPHAMGAGHGEKRASSARQGAAPGRVGWDAKSWSQTEAWLSRRECRAVHARRQLAACAKAVLSEAHSWGSGIRPYRTTQAQR